MFVYYLCVKSYLNAEYAANHKQQSESMELMKKIIWIL